MPRGNAGCAGALGFVILLASFGRTSGHVELQAAPAPVSVISFRLVNGFLLVVDGSMGELEKLNFVIDTGTARTVIHQEIADTLHLPRIRRNMLVFGQDVATGGVVAPSLAFGPVRALDLAVLTADLQPQADRFGFRPDALVGMDVLRHHAFTIDYAAATMTFGRTGEPRAEVSFEPDSPYPVLATSIDGAPYRLIVDSGSEAIVIHEHAIPPVHEFKVDAEVDAYHLTGTVRLKRFTPRQFRVGPHTLGALPVFIISGPSDTPGYDGVLGTRWLPGSRISFDFPRRVVSWR